MLRYIYILIFFSCMRFPPPPQIAVLSLIRTGNTSSHLVARVVGYEVENQLEVPPVHGVDEVAEVVKVAEQRVDLRKGNIGIRAIFPNVRISRGNKSLQRTSKVSIFYTSYSYAVGLAESGTTMTKTIFMSCIPTRLPVIRYVIAKVHHGALVYWRDPDRVHPYVDQVVQPGLDALQVANAVAVRVLERAGVDLVRKTKCP